MSYALGPAKIKGFEVFSWFVSCELLIGGVELRIDDLAKASHPTYPICTIAIFYSPFLKADQTTRFCPKIRTSALQTPHHDPSFHHEKLAYSAI